MADRRVLVHLIALVTLVGALLVGAPQVAAAVGADPAPAGTTADGEPAPGTAAPGTAVPVTIYEGEGCPNCRALLGWFDDLDDVDVSLTRIEVWRDADNRDAFVAAGEELGFEASAVPVTVIDERVWIGYSGPITEDIHGALLLAAAGKPVPPGVYGTARAGTCEEDSLTCGAEETGSQIDVPIIGTVHLDDQSLVVSTLAIGFVDGVNPCSLWVISVLLTIVVRTASRRRVLAIGGAFLLVTAGMYALYMAGIYSAMKVVGFLGWVQWFVAIAAGIFAVVSIKDYFAFKKGLSFTIPDSAKPGIYKRVRAAAGHERLLPALLATFVLAVAVSLIETPCTAGFPVIWTGLLEARHASLAESAGLFAVYMIPFLADEMAVFAVAVLTMRAAKLQEEHGELLKLFAGVTMLALAVVMVADAELMESPVAALALFGGAFVLAWAIHLVTTRVRRRRDAVPAV